MSSGRRDYREIDGDIAGLAAHVRDGDPVAVAVPELLEQRERIVIVVEAHGVAGSERIERAEDGRVTEALRDAARIEVIEPVGLKVQMGSGHRSCSWESMGQANERGAARSSGALIIQLSRRPDACGYDPTSTPTSTNRIPCTITNCSARWSSGEAGVLTAATRICAVLQEEPERELR